MNDDVKRDSFDKLVAGLSFDDRVNMLNNINKNVSPAVTFTENEVRESEKNFSLHIKYSEESFFYRFFLWLRSFIYKKSAEKIYNDDIIASLARRINKNHPGLINHKNKILESIFYEHIKGLKENADFFKPYFVAVNENPGDFYVFLSSFVTPELAENINAKVDPFSLNYDTEPNVDLKKTLLKRLDEILDEIGRKDKSALYESLIAFNWLKEFVNLPFIHFLAQFTNLTENHYTCPYKSAIVDYERFATVFTNSQSISNELLEAIFLFSQRKNLEKNLKNKDIENTVKEFLKNANQNFLKIQMFMANIPVNKIGKIINNNFDWNAGNINGIESWFSAFRLQWRKIIDLRWADWVRERKKNALSVSLERDFGLTEFPVMRERPWLTFWDSIPFSCELTGGFLSWFTDEKFDEFYAVLSEVLTEGIFERSQNKTEFSEGFNLFADACKKMIFLNDRLSAKGEIGSFFVTAKQNHIHSFQSQNKIEALIASAESEIREISRNFIKGCRLMDAVLHGFFDNEKDSIHFSLQNFYTIKGSQNTVWREKLLKTRKSINRCIFYLSELSAIDETAVND